MSLKTSSNGKVLYIYNAGNTIDLYDAETYQYLRTITLDGDMTTELFVLPAPPARRDGPSAVPAARRAWPIAICGARSASSCPYWRRLALVLALSLVSTGARRCTCRCSRATSSTARCSAATPPTLVRVVARCSPLVTRRSASSLNVVSGLRYTRVSADILFDMRLEMYRHLQRLSPRFYARTRLGDIMSRINNDIGEIQRIAAETALAWVGNVLFLAGTVGDAGVARCRGCSSSRVGDRAARRLGAGALPRRGSRARSRSLRQRSADIGSFLIETLQAMRLVVTSNAQEREVERFRERNDGVRRAR